MTPCRPALPALLLSLVVLLLAAFGPARAAAPGSWQAAAEARLAAALERYEGIAKAGGWRRVPAGPTLEPGMVGTRVLALRWRLEATGDSRPTAGDPALFDAALEAAVRGFQERHGLTVDGLVGPETLGALNVTAEARAAQLRRNLARLRAFQPGGPDFLLVDIPGFEAWLVRGAGVALDTRIIVGRPSWPTPTLESAVTRVVINPYWTVPSRILTREIIPRLRRDPGYLARQNMRVFSDWGPNARLLDPAKIDWSSAAARGYRVRQEPGEGNALGRLKFLFPNPYSVYLHDTPSKQLFERPARAFSHGCMRVQKPFELALLLLGGQGWDAARLQAAIDTGRNQEVVLTSPLPIHVVYWTAWVDEQDRAQFRRDIYGRDRAMVQDEAAPQTAGAGCDVNEK